MEWMFAFRLLLAGMLGAIIGLDREYRAKEAGFRTHFLVCLGSALFMIISQYGFAEIVEANGANYDGARVAAQIVSGIGFLGAGTIIFHKQFIRGLTTAAGMWATAGIGMAIGGGMYFLGVAATILVLIGLEVLTLAFGKIGLSSISITFYTSDKTNLEKVVQEIHTKKYHLVQYNAVEESIGGVLMYKAEIVMKVKGHREQSGLFVFIQKLDNISQLKVE
jgi:putative Mg2+ transporter-C (MgtC) family protein